VIPIKPMLAVSGNVFSSRDWLFEMKIDGTRCIAHISNGHVGLQNRRLQRHCYKQEVIASWMERWPFSPRAYQTFDLWK
jgi:ATP-dependent DNA ligase